MNNCLTSQENHSTSNTSATNPVKDQPSTSTMTNSPRRKLKHFLNRSHKNSDDDPFVHQKATLDPVLEKIDDSKSNQDTKLDQILANQALMMKSMEDILKKQEKHDAFFNKVLEKSYPNVTPDQQDTEARPKIISNDVFNPIKPIETLEELIELEEQLQNQQFMDELLYRMSFICGTRDVGNGLNHCYKLVDFFFTRKFMTTCSWAGGSREQKEKIPFKMFKHIMSVFFQLVHPADSTFTLEQCENFFKNVIKNAVRRNECGKNGVVRSSTSKRRPKKLVYRTRERDCEIVEPDVEVDSKIFQDSLDFSEQLL